MDRLEGPATPKGPTPKWRGAGSSEHELKDRRQSPRSGDSIALANICAFMTASPATVLLQYVQWSQPVSLAGAKGELPDLLLLHLKPILRWMFPNMLVALVFGLTLIASLQCDATIEFDLFFLILLLVSWAFLAAVATSGRRGLPEASFGPVRGERRGQLGGPLNSGGAPAVCNDSKKVLPSGLEDAMHPKAWGPAQLAHGSDGGPPSLPAAGPHSRSFEVGDTPVFSEVGGGPESGKVFSKKGSGGLVHSTSIVSLETATPRSDLRTYADGKAVRPPEGLAEQATGEGPQQAAAEGPTNQVTVDGMLVKTEETEQQSGPAEAATAAAAEVAAAAAGASPEEVENVLSNESDIGSCIGCNGPLACGSIPSDEGLPLSTEGEDEAAQTAEERERTLIENDQEGYGSDDCSNRQEDEEALSAPSPGPSTPSAFPIGDDIAPCSGSTELSAWLGSLGEVTLTSSISDLSFCRTQTLAAESLSPLEQSMSIEQLIDEPQHPPLPFALNEESESECSTSPAETSGLHTAFTAGAPPLALPPRSAHEPQAEAAVFPCGLGGPLALQEETPTSPSVAPIGGAPVAPLESIPDHQLLQPPGLQQQLQQQQLAGALLGTSALVQQRRPPRRKAPSVGKLQRRESRAALQYYMGLVKDCCQRRDGAGALRVLEEVQREGRVAPDVQLLNYVLFACVASQDAFLTKRLFEFIEGAGVADIVTYNTMLKSHSLSGQLEEAEMILRRMRERNVPPDEVSYNLLVNAAVCCGRIDRAWHYVDELKTAHMVPDKFTISSLVKSLQPGQNPKLIQRTLRLMDGVDVCEDLILLSTCIDATLRLGDMERLRRLLDRFESSSLSPNAHAYGTLIKAYGRLGNLARVWGLWRDLLNKKNMEPTNYTYGCMLDILLSNNLLADATQLFCRMVQHGVVDAVHFSILVKGLSKYNDQGVSLALEAYSVLQNSAAFRRGGEGGKNRHGRGDGDRSQSQVALNTISFNALLHLCVVNGRMAEALRLFHDMERQGTVAPDLISYSTVIKGLCCCPGDAPLERALALLDQMQKRYGIRPDAIVFNTLIQGAATRKNPALVEHLLNLMQQSNIPPSSYTLCQCVKLYGKCNNLPRALELANELPSRFGFSVDGYVYTALIAACVSNGAAVLAGQLALQANSAGIEIPHGVLCRLWNTLHFTRTTRPETIANLAELNAVYEAIWKLVGPHSKDPSTIGPEGIGVRRSRRRGGKQHTNTSRPKQQQHGGPAQCSGSTTLPQDQATGGSLSSFLSAVQRDWEGIPANTIRGVGDQPEMEGAALWRDNTAGGFPW